MNLHYIYVAITETYYDIYVGNDGKKHRKYHTNFIKFMEGSVGEMHEKIYEYLYSLKRPPRYSYNYIWSYCPIRESENI